MSKVSESKVPLSHERRVELAMATIQPKEAVLGVLSTQVAEKFGKEHFNVMRDVKNLISTVDAEFSALNFEGCTYVGDNGKTLPAYTLTEAGFSLLVMGFTGEEAVKWKIAYITAFQRMREALLNRNGASPMAFFDGMTSEQIIAFGQTKAQAEAAQRDAQLAQAQLAIESAEKEKAKQDFRDFRSVTRLSAVELAEVEQLLGDVYAQSLIMHQKVPASQRFELPSVSAGKHSSRMKAAIKVLCGLDRKKHTYKDAQSAKMPAIRELINAELTKIKAYIKA
jgi:Rha family phage regulatory protein